MRRRATSCSLFPSPLQAPGHRNFIQRPPRTLQACQGMETASVQRMVFEVEGQAEELEVEGPLGRLEFEEPGKNISMRTRRCWALVRSISRTVSDSFPTIIVQLYSRLVPVFANKSAFNEVLNVTSIEEDLGSMPMGPGALGSEITDEDFDDGDEDITSPKPSPSGAITPSESSIRSSDGALTATTMKRRVVRVSDASYATYRAMLYFLYTGCVLHLCTLSPLQSEADGSLTVRRLYSFTPLTPPERRTSRDIRDIKDNASVAGSDVLSDFDPSELTFTQSQHNLNLSNLNASTSSTSSTLPTGSVTSSTPPNANILGASVQRRDSTARNQRRDSGSVTGHVLSHRGSSSQLHSQFTPTSTGTVTGPISPLASSMIPASSFGLNQSLNQSINLGTRPGLHLRSFSSPTGEGEARSASPVVGLGPVTVDDSVPKSNAKSVYKLCHRRSSRFLHIVVDTILISFIVGLDIAELKAAALEHIRCSLTPENVVTEICSPFTSRFPEVRKIEREYLKANWVRLLFSWVPNHRD